MSPPNLLYGFCHSFSRFLLQKHHVSGLFELVGCGPSVCTSIGHMTEPATSPTPNVGTVSDKVRTSASKAHELWRDIDFCLLCHCFGWGSNLRFHKKEWVTSFDVCIEAFLVFATMWTLHLNNWITIHKLFEQKC